MYRYHILVQERTFVSRVTHLGTLNSAMFPSRWHSSNVASVYGMLGLSFIVGNLLLPIISSISSCTFRWTSGLIAMNKMDHFIVVFVVSVPAMNRSWIVRFSCLSFVTRMLISIVSRFICRCLSGLFKELWPFENRKMYRNVLKIHFSNGQNSLENVSISLKLSWQMLLWILWNSQKTDSRL